MDEVAFEIGRLSWDYGLSVAGELDLSTTPLLLAALEDLDPEEQIVLDLEELTFIDSMGLHAICSYARSLDGSRPLVLANPSPAVLRMLELIRIRDLPSVQIRVDAGVAPID